MNLVHFISVLSISSLMILSVSAQPRETKSTDVEALRVLEASFAIQSLSSDPCFPETYPWIKCSYDDTPRITTIDLHDQNIYGIILPDFSSMDALEIIDLSGNIFSQEFPDFLAKFPKLKVLNLAGNFFYGTIPTSLQKNKNVIVTLTGTQQGFLCYSDKDICQTETGTGTSPGTSTRKSKKKLPIILGTVIPIFVVFWAIVGFLAINNQKRKAAAAQNNGATMPGKPMYGNAMSPDPLLHEMSYQDPGLVAESVAPDHLEVNTDQQAHPTV
ncbi:hypothetical protein C5167_000300 [Papaver somniferum]|uniref:Leucine-rich repeat-containing N-terminal plant-type domain-containing protein n=1 Tax=Papaver somniferum TaxID=3469 RepID=A0A4Y7KVK6_PAPSO|nr:LRR receptor-like serine/threonine-protein kinase IOS1 [Papaver somniferum]RZC76208.1 hypothetical protein C5167_000300 [Papaver somniferum]